MSDVAVLTFDAPRIRPGEGWPMAALPRLAGVPAVLASTPPPAPAPTPAPAPASPPLTDPEPPPDPIGDPAPPPLNA